MDPSYYFEYKSADSERTEDADSTGSITGQYGYKTAGGSNILVKYSAGADKGFVIENMEELQAVLEKSAAEAALVKAKPYTGEVTEVQYVGPKVDAATNTQDASYSFGYKVSNKAQEEAADASGSVKGSYSFKTEDGEDFEVKYTSGVGGFVVENLEELLAKANPQSPEYAAVLAEHAAIAAERESLAAEASAVISARSNSPSSPEAEPYIHVEIEAEPYIHEEVPYVHEEVEAEPYIHDDGSNAAANTDASYNFAYSGETGDREESADASGVIQGSYAYTNAEGNNINVVYEAGNGIGFVIKNQDDLSAAILKATQDGAVAAAAAAKQKSESSGASALSGAASSSASSSYSSSSSSSQGASFASGALSQSASALPLPVYGAAARTASAIGSHGSFASSSTGHGSISSAGSFSASSSAGAIGRRRVAANKLSAGASSSRASGRAITGAAFKFNAAGDDHEFMETADDAGERTGSYSYVDPEGKNIVVKYSAGKNGFVILNPREVLPQAPVA